MNLIIIIYIFILINFFLLGCAIDLGYIQVVREGITGSKIEDLDPFYDTGYSFIRATQGRHQAVFILAYYNDGLETWIGANNEVIQTYKGLIIRTSSLDNDIELHDFSLLKESLLKKTFASYITLTNPNADYLLSEHTLIEKDQYSDTCPGTIYVYNRLILALKNNSRLEICTREERVIYSSQQINPFDEFIEIEFYYQ